MDRMLKKCEQWIVCARIPARLAKLDRREQAWANESSLAAAGEHGDDAIEDYIHALGEIDKARAELRAMQTLCNTGQVRFYDAVFKTN